MFDSLLLIPLLPLLASLIIAVLGYPLLKQQSHWPCVLAAAASCVLSVNVLLSGGTVAHVYYEWFAVGDFNARFALEADGLTAVMLSTVTFVGTLIAIYSAGYMHGDPGYPRFFALVSLFLFSMTGLVLAKKPDAFVRLLGRRRGLQLPSDRILVHEAQRGRGGAQGIFGHAHW